MIETLGTATLMAAVETADHDLQLTGIRFREGDLSQPLYPTLFDYLRAPQGVRFEPGVQILNQNDRLLHFRFQLEAGAGVELRVGADGQPVIESAADPSIEGSSIRGLTAAVLLDPYTCQLTWEQPVDVEVTALRLLCVPIGRPLTDGEQVDGGIYLVILNRPKELPVLGIGDPGEQEPNTIKMLGSDPAGRPVYDLFQADALPGLPSDLSLEPTLRVRRGEGMEFAVRIAAPVDLRFVQADGDPQEVKISGTRPPELQNAEWLDQGDLCKLVWLAESMERIGRVSSFFLKADEVPVPAMGPSRFLRIDPTVIQPPSCTGGICI
jgi:hypothetical protein